LSTSERLDALKRVRCAPDGEDVNLRAVSISL